VCACVLSDSRFGDFSAHSHFSLRPHPPLSGGPLSLPPIAAHSPSHPPQHSLHLSHSHSLSLAHPSPSVLPSSLSLVGAHSLGHSSLPLLHSSPSHVASNVLLSPSGFHAGDFFTSFNFLGSNTNANVSSNANVNTHSTSNSVNSLGNNSASTSTSTGPSSGSNNGNSSSNGSSVSGSYNGVLGSFGSLSSHLLHSALSPPLPSVGGYGHHISSSSDNTFNSQVSADETHQRLFLKYSCNLFIYLFILFLLLFIFFCLFVVMLFLAVAVEPRQAQRLSAHSDMQHSTSTSFGVALT
jgi:hypothetical protein